MTQYQNIDQPTAHPAQGGMHAIAAAEPHPYRARGSDQPEPGWQGGTSIFSRERGNDSAAGMAAEETPRPVRRVGIMGAGTLGMAIAMHLLEADFPVTVLELAREPLDRATASVRAGYHEAFMAGELTSGQRDRRVALLAGTINLHHLKDCDVIVDALDGDPGVTEKLLRRLHEVARPDVILVACGTMADVDRLAGLARRPENVLGLHASNGASVAQAWEILPGKATSAHVLATATLLARSFRKPAGGVAVRPN